MNGQRCSPLIPSLLPNGEESKTAFHFILKLTTGAAHSSFGAAGGSGNEFTIVWCPGSLRRDSQFLSRRNQGLFSFPSSTARLSHFRASSRSPSSAYADPSQYATSWSVFAVSRTSSVSCARASSLKPSVLKKVA